MEFCVVALQAASEQPQLCCPMRVDFHVIWNTAYSCHRMSIRGILQANFCMCIKPLALPYTLIPSGPTKLHHLYVSSWSAARSQLTTPVHPSAVIQFGLVHISAGDLLRAEVAAGTDAGKEAASYMDSGNLVPNSVVVEMVVNRLSQPDVQEHGWLLDGYPRSGDQAEAIVQEGIKPDLFVLISVRPFKPKSWFPS